jgi:hypothetical protein
MRGWEGLQATLLACAVMMAARDARAEGSQTVEFRFTPTAHAQMALWIEAADGTFLATVGLTQSVSRRGIANRPGASQMNSGFRYPYGRREGVLPVWAHRRAAAPGAAQFQRVIFQNRVSEGDASRTTEDSSPDSYFCLSFMEKLGAIDASTRDKALDAITCPSGFNSDKGRFLTQPDVARGYAEPAVIAGQALMRPLDLYSLYPPRRDVVHCTGGGVCYDGADINSYDQAARDVMPDIDAVTMATPPGQAEQAVMFAIPADWPDGDYVAWMEVSKEGDYNVAFNDQTYPTPRVPDGAWDQWATDYGYPYRGQPSVVYQVAFTTGQDASVSTAAAVGYGDLAGFGPTGGDLTPMGDGQITDDPVNAPGSGADRLQLGADNTRLRIDVRICSLHEAPGTPTQLSAKATTNPRHSHEWGTLHFVEPPSAEPIDHYDVRMGINPIVAGDDTTFLRAPPAVTAAIDPVAVRVEGVAAGNGLDVSFGGMIPLTTYYVGVRAVDACGLTGPVAVATLTTTKINFTKLSGCFIATAAYGTALEPRVQALRVARDVLRARSATFATATDLYYRAGPVAAAVVGRSDAVRAVVRRLLAPVVAVAQANVFAAAVIKPGI